MLSRKLKARRKRHFVRGVPKFIRVYDNGGESADRYTVVFTGRYRHLSDGQFCYRSMSEHPYHPQGVGLWGGHTEQIDLNRWGFAPAMGRKCHLGRRIRFQDLPDDCRKLVLDDYNVLWQLKSPEPLS